MLAPGSQAALEMVHLDVINILGALLEIIKVNHQIEECTVVQYNIRNK